ncbi:MAG: hypothetical protein EOP85_10690 [Verrucomicrobiaceae bacterium]|nr:MAG: hypothetical protein EOP85_10690 [Verrucomicrobiaceae bacterium]
MKKSVKISVVTCVIIAGTAVFMGWQARQRLAEARELNARTVSEARELGISTTPAVDRETVVTKRERESRDAGARREVEEILAMLEAADAGGKEGKDMSAEFQKIMERLMALDPAGLELVIRDVVADASLDAESREGILGLLLTKLANDGPETLLSLVPDVPEITGDKTEDARIRGMIAAGALENWGKKDPMAAATWIREKGETFPGVIDDGVKQGIVAGAASRDPGAAFKLLGEMEFKEVGAAIVSITRAAAGAEKRTAALAGLRTHLATVAGEEKDEMMSAGIIQLALGAFSEGYAPASKWFDTAGLTPSEMTTAASVLEFEQTKDATGQWLEWMGKGLPADKVEEPVGRIMTKWTEADYQAAGKWLASAPEGPARSASVKAYATTVSRYEPETAAKWAMTLPPGRERDVTLKQIHRNWPENQAAARDTFAKQHGIE